MKSGYQVKRCPWCNSHNLTMDIASETHAVRCLECQAVGPVGFNDSPASAVDMWNGGHRHQNPSALVQHVKSPSNRNDLKWVNL